MDLLSQLIIQVDLYRSQCGGGLMRDVGSSLEYGLDLYTSRLGSGI